MLPEPAAPPAGSAAALYGRLGHFMDDLPDQEFFETGLLLEVPLPLWEKGR